MVALFSNAYHLTISLYVILSEGKRLRFTESKFCELSEANKQNRGAQRRWDMATSLCGLPQKMLHRVKSHRIFKPYPASAKASRFHSFASLNPWKFDFGRRSYTPTSAQNDIQRFCLVICVRFRQETSLWQ